MSHFQIEFTCAWLLLLLIPILALALFPHFRQEKKYRRTRNRIISLVLHIVVATLCVFVLAGMTFSYDTDNVDNEILIVVDGSFSNESRNGTKNDFIRDVIDESDESYKVGVVTFGYNQVYAAPLSNDGDKVYREFMNSTAPDDSATDIASALQFARGKLKSPKSAQIVLISDGVETDREALSVIRSIAADGVKVSAVHLENGERASEVQVVGTVLPDTNPAVDDPFRIGVSVRSSVDGSAKLVLRDNNKIVNSIDIEVEEGSRDYFMDCQFSVGGMHVLRFDIEPDNSDSKIDTVTQNNSYYTYINVESFNKVLIIERDGGESKALEKLLKEGDNPYEVTVVNIFDEKLPATVNELRVYDQVVLNNIANADMPDGFIEQLNSYVYDFGGGVFTVGGNKIDKYGNSVANAYDVTDMAGTLYQEMLPVQVINFTPPVGVMIIIDKSGSMLDSSSSSGQSKIDAAKEGAKSAIRALTSRDYCGIMTLTNTFAVEQPVVSVTQYESLFAVIDSIEADGGTHYTPAIERAGQALHAAKEQYNLERLHVILVSDGLPFDNYSSYSAAVDRNYKNSGITFSVIAIGMSEDSVLKTAAEEVGHGRFYNVNDTDRLIDKMREELRVEEIKGVNYEDFVPTIGNHTSVVDDINPALIPTLGGFYGTKAKVRENDPVLVPLMGKYVPIYAQWDYGSGKVGSFMCDLTGGEWSDNFVNDEVGKQLVRNMVKALMPTYNIHPQDINVGFDEDNYTTNISVYTTVEQGETLQVTISTLGVDGEAKDKVLTPSSQDGYSRLRVAITEPGVYKISVNKLDAQKNVIGSFVTYKAFSYSAEYDMFYSDLEGKLLMQDIAELGGGELITDAGQLFDRSKTFIHHEIDPRVAFIIISIVLFLLDIAVRKFKFKWIHEIVRDRKAKKALAKGE